MTTLGDILNQQLNEQAHMPGIPTDRKVTAIKNLRDVSSLGLREAKDAVELLMATNPDNIGANLRVLGAILATAKWQMPYKIYQFMFKISSGQDYNDSEIIAMTQKLFEDLMRQQGATVEQLWTTLDKIRDDRRNMIK